MRKLRNIIKKTFDGSIIADDRVLKHWPMGIVFIVFALVLIAFQYSDQKTIKKTNAIQRELKELRTEYLTSLSEYYTKKQQTEITKQLDKVGIKPSMVPPKRIVVPKPK